MNFRDCALQMNFNPGSLKESLETRVYLSYSKLALQINYITKTGFTALPLCASAKNLIFMIVIRPTICILSATLLIGCLQPDELSERIDETGKVNKPVNQIRLENVEAENWLTHGRTYSEWRHSPLKQINTSNINQLELVWSYELKSDRGVESTPIVVDGTMYVTGPWSVVSALNAATGEELWVYDPEVPKETASFACCDVVNRGVSFWQGKVYLGSLDGRLIAIDAQSGKEVWSTLTIEPGRPYTITGAPRVANGLVFIGNGGAEYGVRGYVSAYEADSGALRWRFYTVPGNPSAPPDDAASDQVLREVALETWTGKWWRYGGGGTVWDAIVYDPDTGYLLIGVGNGSPHDRNIRSPGGGDNLFLSSIVALKADTGEYVWHYQTTPGDTWDFTAAQQIILGEAEVSGNRRKVLWQAPKNGFFYMLDRTTGEFLSAEPYTTVNWAKRIDPETGRPVETPGSRYDSGTVLIQPAVFGGHNWQPMSYNPETGLVYIPALDTAVPWSVDPMFKHQPGWWNTGVPGPRFPPNEEVIAEIKASSKSYLRAWNPVTQEEAWSVELKGPWNGSNMNTSGNLVFQGTADGRFEAYNATTGEKLWERKTGVATLGGPVSYSVAGEQYIAVPGGFGSMLFLALPILMDAKAIPKQRGRVFVYKLGGQASLPPPLDFQKLIPAPPQLVADAEQVARGADVYQYYCWQCHGANAISAGVLPELRASAALHSEEAWYAIVLGGALSAQGMPKFEQWISESDAESLRAYVTSEARRALDSDAQQQTQKH